jgi:predicted nucleic acid-binding protein
MSEIIEDLSEQIVVAIDASLVQLALARVEQSRISYWDALIVEAAIRSGATILYTEDTHSGTHYGPLEIRNPFLA